MRSLEVAEDPKGPCLLFAEKAPVLQGNGEKS